MKQIACIDLGTNTFHLLIVSVTNHQFTEIYRRREYVILAENGIDMIGEKPIERAKAAIIIFKDALSRFGPVVLNIIGTEALRQASNGRVITDFIIEHLGVTPEIISGPREADLIYRGTQLMIDMSVGDYCIMDIGGGSVEFILSKHGHITFLQSFKVGVTVLYNAFHKSEPISEIEIDKMFAFLDSELKPLHEYLDKSTEKISLVGASGSYEVLQSILEGEVKRNHISTFSTTEFYKLCHSIILKNKEERSRIKGLPKERVNMIVVAFLLVKYILDTGKFKDIIVSPYALKEGVLSEMM